MNVHVLMDFLDDMREYAPGSVAGVVDSVIRDMKVHCQTIKTALEAAEFKTIELSSHALKSVAGQVGAMSLAQLSEDIEDTSGGSKDTDKLREQFASLEKEYHSVLKVLEDYKRSL